METGSTSTTSADDGLPEQPDSGGWILAIDRPVVMIVEDDFMLRGALTELLRTEGYLVECFANGLTALKRLEESAPKPGVILLDIMLPYMDGLEFRQAQLSSPFSDIPVVVMTAMKLSKTSAASLQAARTFFKPLDIPGLLETTRRLCPAGLA
ncbi:MAG TPA: response regulator [Polyangia bacterium]|jgi:CheY-like chemotaxis protein|nr:response regulator [Polyangia bacterium]